VKSVTRNIQIIFFKYLAVKNRAFFCLRVFFARAFFFADTVMDKQEN
jgi:hypothetical protein